MQALKEELGANSVSALLAPAVVAATFSTGAWFAGHDTVATLLSGAAGAAAGFGTPQGLELVRKVAELFELKGKFSQKQRVLMAKHPMAYLYALNRVL